MMQGIASQGRGIGFNMERDHAVVAVETMRLITCSVALDAIDGDVTPMIT
jgi:hypothetical protein